MGLERVGRVHCEKNHAPHQSGHRGALCGLSVRHAEHCQVVPRARTQAGGRCGACAGRVDRRADMRNFWRCGLLLFFQQQEPLHWRRWHGGGLRREHLAAFALSSVTRHDHAHIGPAQGARHHLRRGRAWAELPHGRNTGSHRSGAAGKTACRQPAAQGIDSALQEQPGWLAVANAF